MAGIHAWDLIRLLSEAEPLKVENIQGLINGNPEDGQKQSCNQ